MSVATSARLDGERVDLGIRELLFTTQPRTISGVVVEDVGSL